MISPSAKMTNKPLVTFALFAYNQEKYIEKAIEGALSQTYSPLEIIISDDGSSDQTFRIAVRIAANYKGPHRLYVRRNERNLGLGAHIQAVAAQACGEIIIMAAGDDVSHPDRSESVADVFLSDPSVFSVFTDVRLIDEENELIDPHSSRWNAGNKITLPVLVHNGGGVGTGASYAYRRECFDWPWKFPDFIVSEDRLLPLRAACLGRLAYLSVALVDYRVSKKSLSFVLTESGNLAMMNEIHLMELGRTIDAGVKQKKISQRDAEVAYRIIKELPLYLRFLEKSKVRKSLYKRGVFLIVDNWFHRESFWVRFFKKLC